jgi:hexosaminidase
MFDSKETYSFIPYNLFKNGYENSYGHPVPEEHYEELVALTPEGRENILGIQGQLWTETVNEPGRMEYMIFPRFLSLAERAWAGNPEWAGIQSDSDMWEARDTAWNEFANRVGRLELPRLDRYYEDFNYRIPVPGAVVEDVYLKVNSSFPGFTIRYSLTGETPTEDSDLYEGPVMIEGSELIQVAAFNQEGRSGRAAIVRIGQ